MKFILGSSQMKFEASWLSLERPGKDKVRIIEISAQFIRTVAVNRCVGNSAVNWSCQTALFFDSNICESVSTRKTFQSFEIRCFKF